MRENSPVEHVEKWRYLCPLCGSTGDLRKNVNYGKKSGIRGGLPEKQYHCGECSSSISHVYDKKKGVEVQI